MATMRLGRGGLFLLLRSEQGHGSIGLLHTKENPADAVFIPCSLVGLRTVLNGLEYATAQQDRHCAVKRIGSHVEIIWHSGDTFQTVVRLTARDFEHALDSLNGKPGSADGLRAA
jgi:hypothetical protein